MALGPNKINIDAAIKRIEAAIDSILSNYPNSGRVVIDVSALPSEFSTSYFPEIAKLYKKAGWQRVEFVSDQREGDFITFEA